MAKTKTRKSMLKAVAAGFACMMCCAFFPATALADAANYTGNTARTNVSRIAVNGDNKSFTIEEGKSFTIPAATYTHNGVDYAFGSQELEDAGMESSIEVVYKGTGEKVAVADGKFTASKVGTYVVTYTVVRDDIPYSYELTVVSEATEASFDFEANTTSVIPSVYDVTYAEGADVILPLPTVMGQDEEELLSNAPANFTIDNDTSAITGDVYVNISLTNGGEGVKIYDDKEVDGQKVFYIKGSDISKVTDDKYDYEGQEFKVVYSFYQKVGNENVYIASTSKSFKVKSNYYYQTAEKNDTKRGYDLEGVFSSTFPDSATVGVEKTLPGVIATTKAENSPSSEAVAVYYSIQVMKMDADGKYTIDVTSDTITDGNKFKAKEEGSYKFIYTAKDFYGNEVDKDAITRTITNVKDTISASVFMYDAVNPGYDAEKKTYESAENLLKSKTLNRNVIIYAIGGTDNMVANDKIELRREIRNYGGTIIFSIDQKEYHAYNLVFMPTVSGDTSSMSAAEKENALYKQIVDENFALRSQIILAKGAAAAEDPAAIKEFMAGKYLLVTTEFNKDAFGAEIVAGLNANDETATAQMLAKGYAYIPAEEGQNATFTNNEYTVRYFASDKVNNNAETKMPAKSVEFIKDFTDLAVPTLTFSSNLQAAYLPTDTFTFNVASASDTTGQDSRISAVTAYRYLGEDKAPVADAKAEGKLSYFVQRYDTEKVKDKWYAATGVTPAAHAEGWYIEEGKSSYTVDLTKKPEGAVYVEIFAYAIDDYGNTGFFNKLVKISDATDQDMPVLTRVSTVDKAYTAPEEIALPTLTFSDAKADFMTSEVAVYKLSTDENGKVTKKYITSYGKQDTPDSYLKQFTVSAGYFRASVAGDYQVAITVKDAGNHSVTSYFNYSVAEGTTETLAPTIDNLTSTESNLKPGVPFYLDPPSISMTKDDAYGYIGIEEDDDSNAATWYNVSAISATNNNYEIENNTYFTAYSEGTFKLQYTAYLMKYSKQAVADGVLSLVDGQLKYGDKVVFLDANNDYAVALLTVDGDVEALPTALQGLVTGYEITNDSVITLTVSGATLSINDSKMNLHYADKTEFAKNEKIEIIKPVVEFDGDIETDAEKTTVTITKNSTTLATIKLSDWADTEDISLKDYFEVDKTTGRIVLVFNDDGKYTITYKVVGTGVGGATATDTYTTTMSAGDVTGPELELGDELAQAKYNVGDTLHIAFSTATLDDSVLETSDLVTKDVAKLLKTLEVKIKYEDGSYTTLENQAEEDGFFDYTYELEQKGKYTLSFSVTDEAGNTTTKYKEIEAGAEEASSVNATEVVGGVLIGLSVALLAGVIIYFVVSKKKLDKKEKSYKKEHKVKK